MDLNYLIHGIGNFFRTIVGGQCFRMDDLLNKLGVFSEPVPSNGSENVKLIDELFKTDSAGRDSLLIKKLYAAAAVANGEVREEDALGLAAKVDSGIDYLKTTYEVASGVLDPIEAIDRFIDKAAARTASVLADKAIPWAANRMVDALTTVFPPAKVVAPVIKHVVNLATPGIKKMVYKGVKIVATATKGIIHGVCKTVKSVGKAFSKLFS